MIKTTITNQKFITLEDITVRLFDRFVLSHTSWEINRGENWAVVGPNGSGKSTLVRALAGEVPIVRGRIVSYSNRPMKELIGYVSFELQRDLIREEADRDDARYFSDNFNDLTTTREIIISGTNGETSRLNHLTRIVHDFDLNRLLDRPIRFLSAGEMRKVVIARALLKEPELLILDEPYDGLDVPSRRHIAEMIDALIGDGVQIIFVAHRIEDIPSGISHVVCTNDSAIVAKGRRYEILNGEMIEPIFETRQTSLCDLHHEVADPEKCIDARPEMLVEMNNITVAYGDRPVIKDLQWTMRRGEHWAIVGPNGSGKTTLLNLVAGDNLQAYAQDVSLFGWRRGSGETLGDIRKHIGVVSVDFQIYYRRCISIFDVVLSGFFDSVGLYRYASEKQRESALRWLAIMGFEDRAEKRFDHCSYGEQRLVLLARAMVKMPTLLILDEPCEGLDRANRHMILQLLDYIGTNTGTHLLYVTHREEDIPSCVTHRLAFEKTTDGHYRIRCFPV